MDAKLKAQWVEALRSGKYKQGQASLRRGDSYCCLGVLADISKLGAFIEEAEYPGQFKFTLQDGESAHGVLPDSMLKMIRLPLAAHEQCWKLNDKEGQSFAEIADYIEANIPAEEHSVAEDRS